MNDRLVKLLEAAFAAQYEKMGIITAHRIAAVLEENGVLVLPCKIGEKVFCIRYDTHDILEDVVEDYDIWSIKNGIKLRITLQNFNSYVIAEFGKTVFLTREEAEAAFTERK